jgi:hypothetical protein
LVARLELPDRAIRVRTERESRAHEGARGGGARYSVDVVGRDGRRERRWPELVIERPDWRLAVEFERTAKARERVERIVAGYRVVDVV